MKGFLKDKGVVGLPQQLLVANGYLGSSQQGDKECTLKSSTRTYVYREIQRVLGINEWIKVTVSNTGDIIKFK